MTAYQPAYTLGLHLPGGDVSYGLIDGSVTIDAGRTPFIQLTGTVKYSAQALEDFDPRVVTQATFIATVTAYDGTPGGSTHGESYNLVLRSRSVDRAAGTIAVEFASVDAMLADYAPSADSYAQLANAASLRSVVNSVISQVLTPHGITYTPVSSGPNPDVTPYWEASNLQRNPAVVTNTNNWLARSGGAIAYVASGGSGLVRLTTNSTGAAEVWAVNAAVQDINAQPGAWYNFSCAVKLNASTRAAQLGLVWIDNAGAIISTTYGPTVALTSSFQRLKVSGRAPANAVKVGPLVRFAAGANGQTLDMDAAMLWQGDPNIDIAPFTGSDTGGGYTYAWDGTANASASTRTPVTERDPQTLVWEAGESALAFLNPLLQAHGLRLVADEDKVFTIRDAAYTASGSATVAFADNMVNGMMQVSVDGGWYDAEVLMYTWTDSSGLSQERIDYYELVADPVKVNYRVLEAPYPGPGRAQYDVERAQGRGYQISASAVNNWDITPDQALTVVMDAGETYTGATQAVTFGLETGLMTVTMRVDS